ncbi:tetratricopeptide repeat protein [Armatimonas sp.]|uniref:tetratricopeptide repeat protein n=1 Tax=Armatimonas sp. TaxID=1872638 RepID=UPI00374C983F
MPTFLVIPIATPALVAPMLKPESLLEGLLLAAKGDLPGAEQALRRIAEQSAGKPFAASTETLPTELGQLRVHFSMESGEASAWNNLGAVLLLQGKTQEAMEVLDKAAGLQPEWGAPWANSALVWLAKQQPGKADEIGRVALVYSARNANLYATLAEASLRRRNTRQAEEYIRRALEIEPGHGYATFVRTQVHEQQGKFLEAERDYLQALARNGFVANAFRFDSGQLHPSAGGGGRDNWQQLSGQGFKAGIGGNFQLLRDVGSVEGDTKAEQRLNQARLTVGKMTERSDSLLSAVRREQQDTRGLALGLAGRTGRGQTKVDLLHNTRFSPTSKLHVMGRWRQSDSDLRSQTSGARYSPLNDKQLSGEAEWLRGLTPQLSLQVGGSWLQNQRTEGTPPPGSDLAGVGFFAPNQPFDQVFSAGTTSMWTTHALLRYPVLGRTLTLGPVFGSQAGAPGLLFSGKKRTRAVGVTTPSHSSAFLPYADWAYPTRAGQTLRVSVTPQVGSTAAVFQPGDSSRVLDADSNFQGMDATGNRLGARTLYYGPNGQGVAYEIGLRQDDKHGLTWETTAFHRELRNVGTVSGDPRIEPSLDLVAWKRTRSSGLETSAALALKKGVRLSSFVRWQEARGTLAEDGTTASTSLPLSNVSPWQGNIRVDWNPTDVLRFGVETRVDGARPLIFSQGEGTGPAVGQDKCPVIRRYALQGGMRLRSDQELTFTLVVPDRSLWPGSKPETVILLGLGTRR